MKKCILCVLLTFVLLTGTMYVSYEKAYAGPEVALAPLAMTQPEIALLFAAAMGVVIIANPQVRQAVGQEIYDGIEEGLEILEPGDLKTDKQIHEAWERAQEQMRNGQPLYGGGGSGGSPQSGGGFGGYGLAASTGVLAIIQGVINKFVKDDKNSGSTYTSPAGSFRVVSGLGQEVSSPYSWYISKFHQDNMLNPVFTYIGGTTYSGGYDSIYFVSKTAIDIELQHLNANGTVTTKTYCSGDSGSGYFILYFQAISSNTNFSSYDVLENDSIFSSLAYGKAILSNYTQSDNSKIDKSKSVLTPYTDTTGLAFTSGNMDFTSAIQNSSTGTAEGLLNDLSTGATTIPQFQEDVQPQTQIVPTSQIPTTEQAAQNAAAGQYTDGTSTGTTTDSDSSSYGVNGLKRVFPFCIPFDVYDLLTAFAADAEAPHIHIPFPFSNGFDVDLSAFDSVAQILRDMEVIVWIAGLMYATHKYIKW